MDTKQAIFAFSQGEKIKGGIIWASQFIGTLDSVFDGQRHETRQVGRALVEMVRQEVHLASKIAADEIWEQVDKAMERALVMIDSGVMTESVRHMTTALSHVTTIVQRAMTTLQKQGLL